MHAIHMIWGLCKGTNTAVYCTGAVDCISGPMESSEGDELLSTAEEGAGPTGDAADARPWQTRMQDGQW